jgi:hypothetical protein
MSGYTTIKYDLRFVSPPAFKEAYIYGGVNNDYNLSAATQRIGDNRFLIVADDPEGLRTELSEMPGFEWDPTMVLKVTWGAVTSKFVCIYYNQTARYVIGGEDFNPTCVICHPGSGIAPVVTKTVIIPYIDNKPYVVDGTICVMTEIADIEASASILEPSVDIHALFERMSCKAIAVSELPGIAQEHNAHSYFLHGKKSTIKSLVSDLFEYIALDATNDNDAEDQEERLLNILKEKDNNENK